jgi:ribose transport system substrate-binding protein
MAEPYRLCCLTKNKTNPAYEGARIGAARLANDLGCELVSFTPDVPDSIDEQDALLVEALRLKPDAVLIAPAHTSALDQRFRDIRDAGIPLFFFVTSSDTIHAETFVTSDNHTLAVGIANHLFEHLDGKGNVVILEGIDKSPTSAPRTLGFRDAAAAYPGINIVACRAGNYQHEDAKIVMTEILQEQSDISGVLAANDFMAFGAIEAMQEARREAAVIGLNAMPDAIKAIQDGRLLATVGFDAMTMTCLAVHAAVRFLSGEAVPKVIELPGDVVHAGNCNAWDLSYEQRPLPSWDLALQHARS